MAVQVVAAGTPLIKLVEPARCQLQGAFAPDPALQEGVCGCDRLCLSIIPSHLVVDVPEVAIRRAIYERARWIRTHQDNKVLQQFVEQTRLTLQGHTLTTTAGTTLLQRSLTAILSGKIPLSGQAGGVVTPYGTITRLSHWIVAWYQVPLVTHTPAEILLIGRYVNRVVAGTVIQAVSANERARICTLLAAND